MENLDFSEEEIQEQLAVLGYKNIPKHRLREFKKDLDELIRHGEWKSPTSPTRINSHKSPPATTRPSPPAYTKEKVSRCFIQGSDEGFFLHAGHAAYARNVNTAPQQPHNEDYGRQQGRCDSYAQHSVAQRLQLPPGAPSRLQVEPDPDETLHTTLTDSFTSTADSQERRFIRRKVLRKHKGRSLVCDESIYSEDSAARVHRAAGEREAATYKMYNNQSDDESDGDKNSLNSSFWSDGEQREKEDEEEEEVEIERVIREGDSKPAGHVEDSLQEASEDEKPELNQGDASEESSDGESDCDDDEDDGDDEEEEEEGSRSSSCDSPAQSLMTSGYGTYRPEEQEGGDDHTVTEFDQDSRGDLSEATRDDEEDARSLCSFGGFDIEPAEPDYGETCPASALQSETRPASALENETRPAGALESETRPASALENETRPAGALESETRPAGALENETRPAGALESETRPAGALESETRPAGALESETRPAGALESETRPAGALESETRPAGALESETRPAGALESETRPAGALESETRPAGALESETRPAGALESETRPAGALESETRPAGALESETRPAGALESETRPAGALESETRPAGALESETRPAGALESETRPAGALESETRPAGALESETRPAGALESETRPAGALESETRPAGALESETRPAGALESETRPAGALESETRPAGALESETRPAGALESETRPAGALESETRPAGALESETRPAGALESETRPAGALESETRPAGALESETRPAGALESETRPAGALESETRPAGALESETRPASALESETRPASALESETRPAGALESETRPVSALEESESEAAAGRDDEEVKPDGDEDQHAGGEKVTSEDGFIFDEKRHVDEGGKRSERPSEGDAQELKDESDEASSNKDIKFIDSKEGFSQMTYEAMCEEWEGNRRRRKDAASCLEDRLEELHLSREAQTDDGSVTSHSDTRSSMSAFESYVRGMTQHGGGIRPKPKSFIRPVMTQAVKKTDPVAKYFQYKQLWEMFKLPGDTDQGAIRLEIKERLAYQPPPPKPRRVFVPNSYVVPTAKKRLALRWEVRNHLASGLIPYKFRY